MTASEYLNQGKLLGLEINRKRRAADYAKGDLQDAFKKDIELREKQLAQMLDKIGELPNAYHRIILTDYYIIGMTIERIAEDLNYSDSQIKRHKKKAVKAFAEYYDFVKDDTKVTRNDPK